MPSLPAVNGKQAIKAFEKVDFLVVRIRGSHHIMKKPEHSCVLTVPVHGNKPIAPGTLRNLIKDAGLTVQQFIELLD